MNGSPESDDEADCCIPLLAGHDPQGFGDSAHCSLMSLASGQSQAVKYVFAPCTSLAERDTDSCSDYSHINIQNKSAHRRDGPFSGPPPPYNHHTRNSTSHFQYSFLPGVPSTNVQRSRFQQHQTVSLEDVSRRGSGRGASWSPVFVTSNIQSPQAGVKDHGHGSHKRNGGEYGPHHYGSYSTQAQPPRQVSGCFQAPRFHPHALPPSQIQPKSPRCSDKKVEYLPPRLAPVSGVLSEKASKNLIRPVAFKPGSSRQRSITMSDCQQCGKEMSLCDGCTTFSLSHPAGQGSNPVPPGSTRNNTDYFSEAAIEDSDDSPGVNVDQSPTQKTSFFTFSLAAGLWGGMEAQTPSPSDSGVGELEAMLKEREAEILTLRQVMDRNERAIFQVYEERKNKWLQEMRGIKEEYENKLRVQQQKATQLEQALATQVRRLQQEKQEVTGKGTDVQTDKDSTEKTSWEQLNSYSSNTETSSLSSLSSTPRKASSQSCAEDLPEFQDLSQFPSLQGEMAMKNTEILALRSQLEALQGQLEEKNLLLSKMQEEFSSRSAEVESVHEQLDQLSGAGEGSVCEESTQTNISDWTDGLCALQQGAISDEEYALSLERQIDALREQVQTAETQLETERLLWVEEKNKVIRYQKQLQLNYVQMQRKNTALEAEVEQLTMELESRELNLAALNGEEESAC